MFSASDCNDLLEQLFKHATLAKADKTGGRNTDKDFYGWGEVVAIQQTIGNRLDNTVFSSDGVIWLFFCYARHCFQLLRSSCVVFILLFCAPSICSLVGHCECLRWQCGFVAVSQRLRWLPSSWLVTPAAFTSLGSNSLGPAVEDHCFHLSRCGPAMTWRLVPAFAL